MKDIRDIPETEMRALYAEYVAGLGRHVPAVEHRQGRTIPGEIQNGLAHDSLIANTGHRMVVYGEVKAGELM
jgi:hypothetical protein